MKLHLLCGSCCFMIVLIFSMPFVSLAQQNSELTETKAAAERAAEVDVNKWAWRGIGFVSSLAGLVGCIGGSRGPQTYSSLIGPSDQVERGICIGGAFGCIGALFWAWNSTSVPPPERLIGKSPEYVKYYTKYYKEKVQRLQAKSVAIGFGTGCVVQIIGVILTVDALEARGYF